MTRTTKMITTGVCIALCVVLPMAFHTVPNAGVVFLPMHIPVLLCGLVCGAPFGLLCGALGPCLSNVLTGMPPTMILLPMTVELATYGFVAGLMVHWLAGKKFYTKVYTSLIVAMLFGRVVSGVTKATLFMPGKYTMAAWIAGSFIKCLPGLIIQLTLIPAVLTGLSKAHLIAPMKEGNSVK